MKDVYVNQLKEEDFKELFNRIKLYVNINGKIIPVDYAIQTPIQRYKLEGSRPYLTLFLRNFTCSVGKADEQVKTNIKQIYRDYMLEIFEGTDYAIEAAAYDNKVKERETNKALKL